MHFSSEPAVLYKALSDSGERESSPPFKNEETEAHSD